MSTTTPDLTYFANYTAICRDLAESSNGYWQSRWKHIPDDKLNWSPGGKAKTPLQIAAHVAVSNELFALCLSGNPPVEGGFPELFAWMGEQEATLTTREMVEARAQNAISSLLKTLEHIPAEVVATNEDAKFYVGLVGRHIMDHAGQLDAYQLMWGDDDFHFEG